MSASKAFCASLGLLFILSIPCRGQLSCERAVELHEWALQQLGACLDPATQNTTLCDLAGEYASGQAGSSGTDNTTASEEVQTDQLFLVGNPDSSIEPWQNFLLQAAMTQIADLGEVAYVLSRITAAYSSLVPANTSNEDYFAAWQAPWWEQADANAEFASAADNGLDDISRAQIYWKAANYYFTGFWPFPFSDASLERGRDSVDAFKAGIAAHPTYAGFNFTVSFNNGTASADLPGYLITPDASQALPLLIITGGTDFPKEINVLSFGFPALERGYALLVYDGPGQGEVVRQPPYMPFYPAWNEVLSSVLDFVETSFGAFVQLDKIAQSGVSLGGYLGARACSGNSDRLAACLPNPPIVSVIPAYNRFSEGLAEAVYGPFQYAAQEDPSQLPASYAEGFADPNAIINTLLLTCNASSGAPELIADVFASESGPIDPELVYLAGGYGGAVTGDENGLYSALWQAFRNVQSFDAFDISNISVPVIGFKGSQDDLLGGQEDAFFAELSEATNATSTLLVFDGVSGGALHNQVGSPFVLAARTYAQLDPILRAGTA